MRKSVLAGIALAPLAAPQAHAQAELISRAVLPAATFAPGPTSGQFITGANGVTPPFGMEQPVQGFSGVIPGPIPDTFDFMIDNGFGAKNNSADALLRIVALRPNFSTGAVTPVDIVTGAPTTFSSTNYYTTFSDPDHMAGFSIVAEQTNYPNGMNNIPVDPSIKTGRLLTGADFDPEGFARAANGSYYVGDEFGPFIFHTNAAGQLLSTPYVAPNNTGLPGNNYIQSPDYPTPNSGSSLPPKGTPLAQGSGGFEGFTISPDKSKIYVMLEKSLSGASDPDTRLIEVFDTATNTFETKTFKYEVGDPNGNNAGIDPTNNFIGDIAMINDHEMLVIERDGGEGSNAKFKRVYLVDLNQTDANGDVKKTLVADLMDIADPNHRGGNGTTNGVFTFPFTTIEDVIPINDTTILVGNDNNFPFGNGRTPGLPDNDEMALLHLDTPLDLDPRLELNVRVPEPSTWAIMAPGLVGLGFLARRAAKARVGAA